MNRFTSFVAGIVVGAIGLHGSTNFYAVHTDAGVKVVRKAAPKVEFPYVDVRQFSLEDWRRHKDVAIALNQAGQGGVLKDSALDSIGGSIGNSVTNTFEQWANDPQWNQ